MRLQWLFTGQMTWRELDSYLAHLPMESALRTAQRDQFTDEELAAFSAEVDEANRKHGAWSKQELLIASLIWELRKLSHIQLVRGGVKDLPPPEPVRVPGSAPAKKAVDPRAVTYLQAIRDRNANREAG